MERMAHFYNYKEMLELYKKLKQQYAEAFQAMNRLEWNFRNIAIERLNLREDTGWIETSSFEQSSRGKHYYQRKLTTKKLDADDLEFLHVYLSEFKNPGMEMVRLEKQGGTDFTEDWIAYTYNDSGD